MELTHEEIYEFLKAKYPKVIEKDYVFIVIENEQISTKLVLSYLNDGTIKIKPDFHWSYENRTLWFFGAYLGKPIMFKYLIEIIPFQKSVLNEIKNYEISRLKSNDQFEDIKSYNISHMKSFNETEQKLTDQPEQRKIIKKIVSSDRLTVLIASILSVICSLIPLYLFFISSFIIRLDDNSMAVIYFTILIAMTFLYYRIFYFHKRDEIRRLISSINKRELK